MSQDEQISICDKCGASVYQEHLDSGIARYEADKLLCAHCVTEFDQSQAASAGGVVDDFAPIELDDDEDNDSSATTEMSSSRIHTLSSASLGQGHSETKFNRALQPNAAAATRVRTFHCRLSEGAIEFMSNQINEWADQNENLTIKFVTSTIGLFEGKHTEPNLILTVFY